MTNKRILAITAAVLIVGVIFAAAGCNPSSVNAVGASGINTANRISATVSKLESLTDKDFKFPAMLGEDYYLNQDAAQQYMSHHSKNAFYKKVDDLYALCADIKTANEQCNQLTAQIKKEAAELKNLSKELKKHQKQFKKQDFAEFNSIKKELIKADAQLRGDRNRIKSRLKSVPDQSSDIKIEDSTMRYMMIMSKLDKRLGLLKSEQEKLVRLNYEARSILGSASIQTQSQPSSQYDKALQHVKAAEPAGEQPNSNLPVKEKIRKHRRHNERSKSRSHSGDEQSKNRSHNEDKERKEKIRMHERSREKRSHSGKRKIREYNPDRNTESAQAQTEHNRNFTYHTIT